MTADGVAPISEPALGPALLRIHKRVIMADVDAAGILYFGSAYRWLDELFTGWLAATGHPLSQIMGSGLGCPCVTSASSYDVPLVLDDEIVLSLNGSSLGTTSFAVTSEVTRVRDGVVAVRSTGWHVWCQLGGRSDASDPRPAPVPPWLREAIAVAPMTPAVLLDPSAGKP